MLRSGSELKKGFNMPLNPVPSNKTQSTTPVTQPKPYPSPLTIPKAQFILNKYGDNLFDPTEEDDDNYEMSDLAGRVK